MKVFRTFLNRWFGEPALPPSDVTIEENAGRQIRSDWILYAR